MCSRLAVKIVQNKVVALMSLKMLFFTLNKVLLLLCPLIVEFEREFIINNILIMS